MLKTIIIGIVVTVVGLFALSAVNKATGGNSSNSGGNLNGFPTSETLTEGNTINIAISGQINHPGAYYVKQEQTLGDLITLAGGVTTEADTSAYNVSLVIGNRSSFYIPKLSSASNVCIDTGLAKTNINTASEEELIAIGFKSNQAKALIQYRNEQGAFGAIEDILNVYGISNGTFEKVKDKICIF